MRLLTGYAKPVAALAANADGSRLFAACDGHTTVWEWDVAKNEVVRKHPIPSPHRAFPVVALATAGGGAVVVALVENGGITLRPTGGEPRHFVYDSRVGQTPALVGHPTKPLAVSSMYRHTSPRAVEYGFQVIDTNTGEQTAIHAVAKDLVGAVAIFPAGDRVAAAGRDGWVRVCDVATGKVVGGFEPKTTPRVLTCNPVNGLLAAGCGKDVFVVRGEACEAVVTFKPHSGVVKAMAYSPDGKYLATVAADGMLVLRDGESHAAVGKLHLDIGGLDAVCWAGDGSLVFAGGNKVIAAVEPAEVLGKDKARPKSLEPLSLSGHAKHVVVLTYSPDGNALASGDEEGVAKIWDMSGGAGQAMEKFTLEPGMRSRIESVGWTTGGRLVFCAAQRGRLHDGANGNYLGPAGPAEADHLADAVGPAVLVRDNLMPGFRVRLLDDSGKQLAAHRIPEWRVQQQTGPAVADPSGRVIYFVLNGSMVARWRLDDAIPVREVMSMNAISAIALSADGSRLAVAGAYTAVVCSPLDGKEELRLKHPLKCSGVSFLPDGRLVTSCYDGVVRGWDAAGAEVFALELGMGKIYSLAVSPDGMTFAAGVHKRSKVVLMDVPE